MSRRLAALGSAIFFICAPGVAAGLVPWLATDYTFEEPVAGWILAQIVGGLLVVAGLAVVLHAFARFVLEGFGTPAPVAAPDRLVVGGLYRHVRNPMYVAVTAMIVGQALLFGQLGLLLYAALFVLAVVLFVRLYEEPELTARFGGEYETYRRAVPGWWPRLRPWSPPERSG